MNASSRLSKCLDFMRERCAACPQASIQSDDGSSDLVVTRMRRNIDLAARTSVLLRETNSVHHNLVIPASERREEPRNAR